MKNKFTITTLFFIISYSFFAQIPKADSLYTDHGNIIIQPVLHGTLVIQYQEKTIYIDPYGGVNAFKNIQDPNLILITDIHGDHLDLQTLKEIKTKEAKFIVPQAVADKLPKEYHENLNIMNNGDILKKDGISIKAIPMYNLPETPDAKHPKGRGNGYILILGEKKIYISGDTEDIKEMRKLKGIDVAFICMNLPYTMDIHQAASAVLELQPKIVYPYHYRGKPNFSDIEAFKTLVDKAGLNIDVRLRDWYPNYDE